MASWLWLKYFGSWGFSACFNRNLLADGDQWVFRYWTGLPSVMHLIWIGRDLIVHRDWIPINRIIHCWRRQRQLRMLSLASIGRLQWDRRRLLICLIHVWRSLWFLLDKWRFDRKGFLLKKFDSYFYYINIIVASDRA